MHVFLNALLLHAEFDCLKIYPFAYVLPLYSVHNTENETLPLEVAP